MHTPLRLFPSALLAWIDNEIATLYPGCFELVMATVAGFRFHFVVDPVVCRRIQFDLDKSVAHASVAAVAILDCRQMPLRRNTFYILQAFRASSPGSASRGI